MSTLLRAVARAAARRTASDEAYRAAIAAARDHHTLEEIGQAAGISKQGVRYLLHPDPRKERKT